MFDAEPKRSQRCGVVALINHNFGPGKVLPPGEVFGFANPLKVLLLLPKKRDLESMLAGLVNKAGVSAFWLADPRDPFGLGITRLWGGRGLCQYSYPWSKDRK